MIQGSTHAFLMVVVMDETISQLLQESASLKSTLASDRAFTGAIAKSAAVLFDTVSRGGTVYACGNGGSTCDAMHLVEEMVGRYKRKRQGLRAQHLMDASVTTCWANDESFDDVYRRYVEVFCTDRDTLVAISTSGNSGNILKAVEEAKKRGTRVIGLTGKDGGKLAQVSDIALTVPSPLTERIQEVHITIIHIWLELLETRYGLAS
jgi:D-sedoheptulose 7-phosphate isomerase